MIRLYQVYGTLFQSHLNFIEQLDQLRVFTWRFFNSIEPSIQF